MRCIGVSTAILLGALSCGILAAPAALALRIAHPVAASYSGKQITFSYPSGWKVMSSAQARSLGSTFTSAAKGTTLQDVAGVSKQATHNSGAVVVVLKASFSPKLQTELKGQHAAFMTGFVNGLTGTKNMTVVSRKNGVLNGQAAKVVDVLQRSGKSVSHQEYAVSLAADDKSMNLALYLTSPATLWSAYAATFATIGRSIHIR